LQATRKKKSERCPSNQVSAAVMAYASDEKWRIFNSFLQSGRAKDLSAPLYKVKCIKLHQLKWCGHTERIQN